MRPSDHPTTATVMATGPTLRTPCVYCKTQYRSAPCGAVHANVAKRLRAARRSPKGGQT